MDGFRILKRLFPLCSYTSGDERSVCDIASRICLESAPSGATEKNSANRGSVNIRMMKIVATVYVLKFLRAISSSPIS